MGSVGFRSTNVILAGMLWPAVAAATPAQPPQDLAEAYTRAARVLDGNLAGRMRNAAVAPHWIEGGDRFWYRRDGAEGPEWVVVESATGASRQAFDPARLRAAAARALDTALPEALPVTAIDGDEVRLDLGHQVLRCTLADDTCVATPRAASPGVLWSADGRHGVFVRDHDLWLQPQGDAPAVALTDDGVAHFAYGTAPGTSLFAIPRMRATQPLPPVGLSWSPDGTRLMSVRVDERAVPAYPFLESVPQDGSYRPKVWAPRIPLMGDAERGIPEVAVLDVAARRQQRVEVPDGWELYQPVFQAHPVFHWSTDGRRAWSLAATRGMREIALAEIDLDSGAVRLLAREAVAGVGRFNAFVYSPPNVRILEASGEAVWFSERDDWGQLYLIDLETGAVKRRLTDDPRTVRDVIGVDETRRRLFYTAGGSERDPDPYYVRAYSVSLDGGASQLLTPEDGVHLMGRAPIGNGAPGTATTAGVSPDGAWLLHTYSHFDQPPVTVLRSADDGRVVRTLETAEVSALAATGWRAPTRVQMVSADGVTPIWGSVYFPPDMQPGRTYPVINAIYAGPQVINAVPSYQEAVATLNPRSRASLAELGFIVVTIDGRGTPGRSKTFNNASYAEFAEPALADHVAGIRQLAERYGSLDLDRVGIYGHSFGGYTSARGILTYPDFFKVAVSSAGPHNFQGFYPVDSLFPVPDYGDGRTAAPDPQAIPDNYADLDMLPLAERLTGKLLLVYGELDENAPPAVTLQLVDALIRANKPYDLMYLPNRDHGFFRTDAYYTQRMWDYFVEHLLGGTPPADFRLELEPPTSAFGF